MNTWLIKHAQIVTPTGIIPDGSLWVEDGIIREIGATVGSASTAGRTLDAAGAIVMPGIIDIHTDAMDLEIVPRPGADIPVTIAFRELERKMSSCGITTVFHSLHLGYEVAEKHSMSKYSREMVFREVFRAAAGPTLLHNKIHLRYELSGVGAYDKCVDLIEEGYVALLSVMDHTPGQGQFSRKKFLELVVSSGKTEAAAEAELEERFNRPRIGGGDLEALIELALSRNIPVASHDDDTIEKVDAMQAMGVEICEFPITLETAHHATRRGLHVAGGASNILRGGSLSGNLNMTEAVKEGAVGILCSDYYPAAILHSVFKLHLREGLPLHTAVNLATLHPARAAKLDTYTGSLEPGKQADLLVVRLQDGIPMVTHNMVSGTFVLQTATK